MFVFVFTLMTVDTYSPLRPRRLQSNQPGFWYGDRRRSRATGDSFPWHIFRHRLVRQVRCKRLLLGMSDDRQRY